MKLEDIVAVTEGELLVPSPLDLDLQYGFASDLMSDVLHYAQPQTLLLTGLTNLQSVRTAEMADLPAILFARAKCPPLDTLELARQVGIAVVSSPYTLYEVCGLLFRAGLAGQGKLGCRKA
jgi:hypothetical protein